MHAELSPAAQEEYPLEEIHPALRGCPGDGNRGRGRNGRDTDARTTRRRSSATVATEAFGDVEGSVALPLDEEGADQTGSRTWSFPAWRRPRSSGARPRLGERAPLLASDGSPLAEGPASARTSPLGPSALAIAGAMGSPSRKQDTAQYALGFPEGRRWPAPAGSSWRSTNRLAGQPSGELFAVGRGGPEEHARDRQADARRGRQDDDRPRCPDRRGHGARRPVRRRRGARRQDR